jgi:predicted GIY-YIG superfamily endonuclease
MPRRNIVYLLQSQPHPQQRYVGLTQNLQRRLAAHNAGTSKHTAKHRPWHLVVAVWLNDEGRARAFENYLKSGSGRAFAQRHFG